MVGGQEECLGFRHEPVGVADDVESGECSDDSLKANSQVVRKIKVTVVDR